MLVTARNGGIAYAEISAETQAADKARELRDVEIAVQVGKHLEAKLPGHFFRVEVLSDQGVVVIRSPLLPPDMGCIVKMREMASDPAWYCITREASALLERFNVARARRNPDRWMETMRDNRHVRMARGGVLKMVDLSTGRIKHVVPDALAR